MCKTLKGKNVAILLTDGFEQVEMTEPRKALTEAGARAFLVSPKDGKVQGYHHDQKADEFPVDVPLAEADPENFDALVLPGGVANPDALRIMDEAIAFIKAFHDEGKPIAAICHGSWPLIEAGVVSGKTLTSWPSLQSDLRNAGGKWVDWEVVSDNGLITSRKPDDLPVFNRRIIEEFAKTPAELITEPV